MQHGQAFLKSLRLIVGVVFLLRFVSIDRRLAVHFQGFAHCFADDIEERSVPAVIGQREFVVKYLGTGCNSRGEYLAETDRARFAKGERKPSHVSCLNIRSTQ
jgi:hypothetical protein